MIWMNLKYIILSERNQAGKAMCCLIPLHDIPEMQNYRNNRQVSSCQGQRWKVGLSSMKKIWKVIELVFIFLGEWLHD